MAADWLEIRQKQLKATRSRQNQVYLAFLSQKHVRCEADQSQGSWRVICNWFCNVPVFGINVTRYTFCCLKNIHIYIYIFAGRSASFLAVACPFWRRFGRGAGVCALLATCERSLGDSKSSGNPKRSLFGDWTFPERNGFWAVSSVARSRLGELQRAVIYFSFRRDQSLYNANYSAPSEIIDSLGKVLQKQLCMEPCHRFMTISSFFSPLPKS